jgi:hypothetical protein
MPNYVKLVLVIFSGNKTLFFGRSDFMNFVRTLTSKLFDFNSKGNLYLMGSRRFMNFPPAPTSSLFALSSEKVSFEGKTILHEQVPNINYFRYFCLTEVSNLMIRLNFVQSKNKVLSLQGITNRSVNMRHPLVRFSFVLVLLSSLAAMGSSCKNSTSPPSGTPVKDTLTLSKSVPDTIVTRPGENFSITLSLGSASGQAADSAAVNYVDPILVGTYLVEAHNLPATVTITDTVPVTTDLGLYTYSFTATTPDYAHSQTITVYVKVVGRSFAKMNLRAHAVDPTSIALAWTRPPNDHGTDTVVVMSGSSITSRTTRPSPDSTQIITGLQTGTVYTFFVLSSIAYSDTIRWATAQRFPSVRLYETADNTSGENAGLVVSTGTSVSITGTDAETSDIVLATDPTSLSGVTVVSPAVTSLSPLSNGKNTKFSDFNTNGSLDYIYYHADTDISNRFKDGVNSYEVPSNPYSDFLFEIITADNHYAQVELQTQPNGQIVGGSGTAHFVDVIVSYQPAAGMPYVARPRPLMHSLLKREGRLLDRPKSSIKIATQN